MLVVEKVIELSRRNGELERERGQAGCTEGRCRSRSAAAFRHEFADANCSGPAGVLPNPREP